MSYLKTGFLVGDEAGQVDTAGDARSPVGGRACSYKPVGAQVDIGALGRETSGPA